MKKTNNYTINHVEGIITLNKTFNKRTNNPKTSEYREIVRLRKDFPDYRFELKEIDRNKDKTTYANLTYEEMEKHIKLRETNPAKMLQAFENVKNGSSISHSRYSYVKQWFLSHYPDYNNPNALIVDTGNNNQEEATA